MKTILAFHVLFGWHSLACADGKTQAIQETAAWVMQRFGRQTVREGTQSLALRLERYVASHGEEFLQAVRQVGPRAFQVVDGVGAGQARQAVGIMTRHGEKGVVSILSRPQALRVASRFGEKAEVALVKHPALAENVIEKFGTPAIRAMESLGPQAGRRMAMMTESGELAALGRSEELLAVIGKYGDRAMSFVWSNKGSLGIAVCMTAFLANPEPFIEGTAKLAGEVVTAVAKPLAEAPGIVLKEIASSINWTVITLAGMAITVLLVIWKRRPPTPA